ncbi:hypothetical protein LI99_33145 [Mycolicibacterium smegmatis]|uniref:Uncharacterized protein n=2 Tax=Mycolicibacterium smegmatis (strain ATCC 700084 / mc(2)155) TaxID=246196 RepID=I7GG24_MYCS2|nr:hypothetical protein MSMEG_6706 [Mycolicibacterium smegmatis MC2 155]AIU18299.1 hypothetical protein LI99_33145 [Mycolicibacterium smegmatis]AFP42951.1 hypothetical protein MSMEI_6525 [Mycolicibacterium smegmatis MC2 155]AIU11674.1 hypothetical protein LJ00_33140 [Mycolicibacterium smegmatis MC2 155]AIU24921.1 hypothetical protein LI98_33150 [Mycolicibacterium smegmatis]
MQHVLPFRSGRRYGGSTATKNDSVPLSGSDRCAG